MNSEDWGRLLELMQDETVDIQSISDTVQWALPVADADAGVAVAIADGYARYESLGVIGQGGMGRVMEARDRQFGRILALKEGLGNLGVEQTRRFFQ